MPRTDHKARIVFVVEVSLARIDVDTARATRKGLVEDLWDLVKVPGADKGIDLGQLLCELGAVALGQAARDKEGTQAL